MNEDKINKRLKYFQEYIETCEIKNEYVGLGNPLADILLIGKEPSLNINAQEHIQKNIRDIKACLLNDDLPCLYVQPKPAKASHTWNIYQKIIDYTYNRKCEFKDKTDFCTFAFTTEMNNTVSLRTVSAKQNFRLNTLKESLFIQDFPVVILACSNYIQNIEGNRQINDTFSVKYDLIGGSYTNYSKGNWFYTHHSDDGGKLVIHTRQLSQNCKDKLLQDIASVVSMHLNKLKGRKV